MESMDVGGATWTRMQSPMAIYKQLEHLRNGILYMLELYRVVRFQEFNIYDMSFHYLSEQTIQPSYYLYI